MLVGPGTAGWWLQSAAAGARCLRAISPIWPSFFEAALADKFQRDFVQSFAQECCMDTNRGNEREKPHLKRLFECPGRPCWQSRRNARTGALARESCFSARKADEGAPPLQMASPLVILGWEAVVCVQEGLGWVINHQRQWKTPSAGRQIGGFCLQ